MTAAWWDSRHYRPSLCVLCAPTLSPTIHVVRHGALFKCVVTVIGHVIGTSAPTENMLYVRVCKVDVCETYGLDWVGIIHSTSALVTIMVNLGFRSVQDW